MRPVRAASLGATLLALTAVAYLPVWDNDLVDFDDEVYITRVPQVTGGLTWQGFRWAWTNDEAPYRIPITWLSLQFDAHWFSARTSEGAVILSPAAFHGQNLFWHGGSALLLFGLCRRLAGRCAGVPPAGARWGSFLVAALFAVHPMHVESVAWAVERKDVLSVFFGLLTLWAYLRYLEDPGWKWYLALVTAYLLSLLSKPMLITLPFVLLLLDYWPLRRLAAAPAPAGKAPRPVLGPLVLEKMPLFALAAGVAVLTMATREEHGAVVPLSVLPLSARVANALTAYDWYLTSTFWPLRLGVLYPHPHHNWSPGAAFAGAATLLSLTALALWQVGRRPWLIVGWLWFVGTLVPVIGLAQGGAQSWADRFSYWPHIGLFVAVVWGAGELAGRFCIPAAVVRAAGVLVLGSLAALTWVQVGYWRDSLTLWERALAVTENNDRAHERAALCYRKLGRLDEANFHSGAAYRIQRERRVSAPR
jgi:hypothetical protein